MNYSDSWDERRSRLWPFSQEVIKAAGTNTVRELFNHCQGNCIHIHPTVLPQINPSTPSANSTCSFFLPGGVRPVCSEHSYATSDYGGDRKILVWSFVHMLLFYRIGESVQNCSFLDLPSLGPRTFRWLWKFARILLALGFHFSILCFPDTIERFSVTTVGNQAGFIWKPEWTMIRPSAGCKRRRFPVARAQTQTATHRLRKSKSWRPARH